MQQPRRAKISTTTLEKPEIIQTPSTVELLQFSVHSQTQINVQYTEDFTVLGLWHHVMSAGEIYTIRVEAVSCSRASEFCPKSCTAVTKDTCLMIHIIVLIPGLPCYSQSL
jgi:hypothetical protein